MSLISQFNVQLKSVLDFLFMINEHQISQLNQLMMMNQIQQNNQVLIQSNQANICYETPDDSVHSPFSAQLEQVSNGNQFMKNTFYCQTQCITSFK